MTELMPTLDGDVVIMHDAQGAAPDQYVLWTACHGQQRPLAATDLVVKTGFDAARTVASLMATVTSGRVFLLELDTLVWVKIFG